VSVTHLAPSVDRDRRPCMHVTQLRHSQVRVMKHIPSRFVTVPFPFTSIRTRKVCSRDKSKLTLMVFQRCTAHHRRHGNTGVSRCCWGNWLSAAGALRSTTIHNACAGGVARHADAPVQKPTHKGRRPSSTPRHAPALTHRRTNSVKPKFHYADFPVKARVCRGLVTEVTGKSA